MRQIILTPVEDGYWMAKVPSLPGCQTQGATKEKTLAHIQEAMELYIETLQELGRPIPPEDGEGITEIPANGKVAPQPKTSGLHQGTRKSRVYSKTAKGKSHHFNKG